MLTKCGCCKKLKDETSFGIRVVRGIPTKYKSCIPCIEDARSRNNDPAVKAKKAEWKKKNTEKVKSTQDTYNHRLDVKTARQEYQKGAIGKERKLAYYYSDEGTRTRRAWEVSVTGKESMKKRNKIKCVKENNDPAKKLNAQIGRKICRMLSGQSKTSQTAAIYSDFPDAKSVVSHFESMLTGGMTLQNHGTVWHIGHRIARAMYDKTNPEDMKRCWKSQNLFPQLVEENLKLGVKLPEELESLKPIWPTAWTSMPDKLQRKALERHATGRYA